MAAFMAGAGLLAFACADESGTTPVGDAGTDGAGNDSATGQPDAQGPGDSAPPQEAAVDSGPLFTLVWDAPNDGDTITLPRPDDGGADGGATDGGADAGADEAGTGDAGFNGPPGPYKFHLHWDTDMTVMPPKTCGTTPRCGHAHLTIDGTDCNAQVKLADGGTANLPYNLSVNAKGDFWADTSICKSGPTGKKVVRLELRQDNHAALAVPIFIEKTITFQ